MGGIYWFGGRGLAFFALAVRRNVATMIERWLVKFFTKLRRGVKVEAEVHSMEQYFPILIYLVAVLGFAAVSLFLPHLVAPRKKTAVKEMPYESGMDPVGDTRKPLDVKFYLIAILFLVFDVELLFIYPWAVAIKADGGFPQEMRTSVLAVMAVLIGTLGLAYLYAWRKGVFQWRQK